MNIKKILVVCSVVPAWAWSASHSSALFESRNHLPSHRMIGHLTDDQIDDFTIGKSFFTKPWVLAPSATTARDGLGPLFNANACLACHATDRLATPITSSDAGVNRALVFKLAQPQRHEQRVPGQETAGDPVYGIQISINGGVGVPYEAHPTIQWKYHTVPLTGEKAVQLRQPIPILQDLQYGPLDPHTTLTVRFAPLLVGEGLIEKIPTADIVARAKAQAKANNGIHGRPNWVDDPVTHTKVLGRFGFKASTDSLEMQTAHAAIFDMGLTNKFYPYDACTETQVACRNAPKSRNSPVGLLDLPDNRLRGIAHYLLYMRSPENIPLTGKGFALFQRLQCVQCHQPTQKTADGTIFEPFSDLLLHNMGPGLADQRPEYEATGEDWRTAPLWGLGAKVRAKIPLLHDGRARNITEAILWHGGEAQKARQAFQHLTPQERATLIQFLETL